MDAQDLNTSMIPALGAVAAVYKWVSAIVITCNNNANHNKGCIRLIKHS